MPQVGPRNPRATASDRIRKRKRARVHAERAKSGISESHLRNFVVFVVSGGRLGSTVRKNVVPNIMRPWARPLSQRSRLHHLDVGQRSARLPEPQPPDSARISWEPSWEERRVRPLRGVPPFFVLPIVDLALDLLELYARVRLDVVLRDCGRRACRGWCGLDRLDPRIVHRPDGDYEDRDSAIPVHNAM